MPRSLPSRQHHPGYPKPTPRVQQEKALAKYDLLAAYQTHMKKGKHGNKAKLRKSFMQAYNAGLSYPKIFELVGKTSWKTIEGWKAKLKENNKDCFCLADSRGSYRRGACTLTKEQQEILLRCALHPNRPKIAESIRMAWAVMHAQGVQNGRHESTYRRWLTNWRDHNYHIWVFTREGAKAWNDKCAMYIERDYNLINVGDVVVADGHVLNFEIINPFTGKPKRMTLLVWIDMKSTYPLGWEIMPTENVQTIHSALRRAIITLGKYPQVAYLDNGKAFRARFFTETSQFDETGINGLYERLGMKTIFAWPYHGQSKTVERFFGSFAELERWAPTYVGTSIDKKPPRMMRGERLHRRVYDNLVGDAGITLEQAHRAIAAWFDEYARRPKTSGHLAGKTPLEVYLEGRGPGIDHAELHYLMMERTVRHIRRNGIRLLGQNYYDPALYGRRQPVVIKYDLQDPSAIYVFEPSGDFICAAHQVDKIHPAANALGDSKHQKALVEAIKMKRTQERDASIIARDLLENEVIPEHRRQMERLGLTERGPIEPKALPENVKRLPSPDEIEKAFADQDAFKARENERFWDDLAEICPTETNTNNSSRPPPKAG